MFDCNTFKDKRHLLMLVAITLPSKELQFCNFIKATIKEIQGINSKAAIYDPSLAHKGGSGGKTDRLFRLSTYAFPIPLNTF